MCTSILSTNRRLHYKVTSENQSHPREPLMCFDLEVSKPHELSDFNIDLIECAWCQSIGNWGQKTQISRLFYEIVIEITNSFWTKLTSAADLLIIWHRSQRYNPIELKILENIWKKLIKIPLWKWIQTIHFCYTS